MKRGVVRVVTPGTAIDSSMFENAANNYLMAISGNGNDFGLSFFDVSTGEFLTTQFSDSPPYDRVAGEVARMSPAECIICPSLAEDPDLSERLNELNIVINHFDTETFDPVNAEKNLKDHFKVSTLEGMGCEGLTYSISAAGAALAYAMDTQMRELGHVHTLRTYSDSDFMILDSITLRNLEVVRNVRGEGKSATILGVLDDTMTPMGSRILQKWILKPLISTSDINKRLDAVEEFTHNTLLRYDIRSHLSRVRDIERLTGRIVYGNSNARDLVALKKSLEAVPEIRSLQKEMDSEMIVSLTGQLYDFSQLESLIDLIDCGIVDEPPVSVRDGGLIKSGYSTELDEIRGMSRHGKEWIASFQKRERERTGIKSLKVGYNKVFGYYIEVTKANSSQVPEDYIIKQTMANSERFYTPELKKWEEAIISADEKITTLEYELFSEINSKISDYSKQLQKTADVIGKMDVLSNLAEIAVNRNYTRPAVTADCRILVRDGRHPVVESSVPGGFVPNDTEMDCSKNQFALITGPNMAGKSTYMRQVALIVIMAQAGSFVPASHASIGLVDRIFTRVGAFDDLASGQSTFMVEMVELANILNNATPKSLILLDEIGRGTSTYDGYSIAKAVVEYIHNKDRAGVRSMFATHYHQLTDLSERLERVNNYHIAVREEGDDLVFLRKIIPGATDKSYGIHVARLAGVPRRVTQRAKEILEGIENESSLGEKDNATRKRSGYTQLIFDIDRSSRKPQMYDPVADRIRNMNLDEMTPLEALNTLNEIKNELNSKEV